MAEKKNRKAMWKGAISFGLVNIPVRMYTATQDHEISFVLLHKKDLSEIRYARFCKVEDKEVPWSEIVKGYELGDGNFVTLTDEDFEKADPKKTKTLEIVNFVDEDAIDSVYYVKPYFLEPDKNAENAYSLLREALKKSGKVGLARYVLRNKEHLAVIKLHGNALIVNEMRYQNELMLPAELKIPASSKASAKEVDVAVKLINQLTVPFKPEKYKDSYVEEIKQIIKKKAKGRPIQPKTVEPKSTKVRDIMSLLKASLEETPRKKTRKTA